MFGIIKIFVLIYDTGKINFSFETGKNQVSHSFFWRKRHSSLNVQKENLN